MRCSTGEDPEGDDGDDDDDRKGRKPDRDEAGGVSPPGEIHLNNLSYILPEKIIAKVTL